MIDRLVYEDIIGSVHFSSADDIFFGKLEGVNDLVTFEGSSVRELKKSFIEEVYEAMSKEELSLNQLVQAALKKQLVK